MSVNVRERPIANGRKTLYLDYYPEIISPKTGKATRREYLGIYVYAKPKDEIEANHNSEMRETAKAIMSLRIIAIKNEQFDFIDKEKGKADFLEYYKTHAEKQSDIGWILSYQHFKAYRPICTFNDLNKATCKGFRDFLLTAKNKNTTANKPISQNTAASYFGKFRALLRQAYKNEVINIDINGLLDSIKTQETEREFLSIDELKTLAETPCEVEVLKRAALFSALTGLRFVDIHKLLWSEIQGNETEGFRIDFRQKKTGGVEYQPISNEARELLGDATNGSLFVFDELETKHRDKPFKKWIKAAGIQRNITFHAMRHTSATALISQGVSIYVVQKLLGHRSIKTTQVYAHLVDNDKREAANKISLKR